MFARSLLAVMILAVPVLAQPPTLEVRLRSANDLLERADYLASLVGQEEATKQFRGFVKALSTETEGLEGLDLSRPLGAYAFVKPDVVDSPFVVMIPIANEARFLQMLKDRLEFASVPKDGVHSWPIPRANESLHFRFADGYLHASLRREALDAKTLLKPDAFFKMDDGSVASVILRISELPEDFKQLVFGQIELRVQDGLAKETTSTPLERAVQKFVQDAGLAGFKCVLEDARDVRLALRIEPKLDFIQIEQILTAKPGTPLEAAMRVERSFPEDATTHPLSGVRLVANASIPEPYRGTYRQHLARILDEFVESMPMDQREPARRIVDVLRPTLEAGRLDGAFALNSEPRYVEGLIRVADTKPLLDFAKAALLLVPGEIVSVEFDREKIGDFTLHRVDVKALPEEQRQRYGTRVVWLATSKDYLIWSIRESPERIQSMLKAKAKEPIILHLDFSMNGLLALTGSPIPEETRITINKKISGPVPTMRDQVEVVVIGGPSLYAKLRVKGRAIAFLHAVEQAKTK